jgi:exodeoxyribonuclease III
MPIVIGSWNVNSVNARLDHLLKVLKTSSPDIILLQELKCLEEKFPHEQIQDAGYNIVMVGQKTYNGVAIFSKTPLEDIKTILPGEEESGQARYIEATTSIKGTLIRIASVYVPNGQAVGSEKFDYKMSFFSNLHKHLESTSKFNEPFIIGGDYNVAPENIDVWDPQYLDGSIGFHIDERAWFRKLQSLNYSDSFRLKNPNSDEFSWWDYRAGSLQRNKGMRIDHILLSPEAADLMHNAWIDKTPRTWEKASDHTTIYVSLNI